MLTDSLKCLVGTLRAVHVILALRSWSFGVVWINHFRRNKKFRLFFILTKIKYKYLSDFSLSIFFLDFFLTLKDVPTKEDRISEICSLVHAHEQVGGGRDWGARRAFLCLSFLFLFTVLAYVISHPQFSEQQKARLYVPLQLQVKGGLSMLLFWLPSLSFSCLHRALLAGSFNLQTLGCILLRTWGSHLPFAAGSFHVFSLCSLDSRIFFPLLGPSERQWTFRWLPGQRLGPFWSAYSESPLAHQREISLWCPRCAAFPYVYVRRWLLSRKEMKYVSFCPICTLNICSP